MQFLELEICIKSRQVCFIHAKQLLDRLCEFYSMLTEYIIKYLYRWELYKINEKNCSNLDKYLHQSEWYKMERKTAPIGRTCGQKDQQTIAAEETYQVG